MSTEVAGPRIPQPYPGATTDCYAQAQWHEYTTVVTSRYTIPGSSGETLDREDVRVVCRKCGDVIDPFEPPIKVQIDGVTE